MGGRVGGCLGLFPGVCCPTSPHAPLKPDSAFPGAAIGNMSGNSFKPTSPNHPPRRPPNDLSKSANITDVVFATSPRNCCPDRRILPEITTFRGIRRGFRTKAVERRGQVTGY